MRQVKEPNFRYSLFLWQKHHIAYFANITKPVTYSDECLPQQTLSFHAYHSANDVLIRTVDSFRSLQCSGFQSPNKGATEMNFDVRKHTWSSVPLSSRENREVPHSQRADQKNCQTLQFTHPREH